LFFRVGIHYGEALLGLVGTEQRLDYTAIGDSVNVAKRLQESAEEGKILVSKPVAFRIMETFELRPLDPIRVEGKEHPIEVFELLALP
jgi:class 3 adenylate cyclase